MLEPGSIVRGKIISNGDIRIEGGSEEYILVDNIPSNRGVGDSLPVRLLNSNRAATLDWRADLVGEKQGYDGEFYAVASRLTNGLGAIVEPYSDAYDEEVLYVGRVLCTVGASVPVIPLNSSKHFHNYSNVTVGLCTDPSVWDGDYITSLASATDLLVSDLSTLQRRLEERDPIKCSDNFATELQQHNHLVPDSDAVVAPPQTPPRYASDVSDDNIHTAVIDNSSNNQTRVDIDGDTHQLFADSDRLQNKNDGDEVRVRVPWHNNNAILIPSDENLILKQHIHPKEQHVQIYRHSNSKNPCAVGVADTSLKGETVITGPVECPVGTHIPVVPTSDYAGSHRVVICTDVSVWNEKYKSKLANLGSIPPSQIAVLKDALASRDDLTSIQAGEYITPVMGVIDRFSNNENAVITVGNEEYVLRGDTEKSPGDTIRVRIVSNTYVAEVDRKNCTQDQNVENVHNSNSAGSGTATTDSAVDARDEMDSESTSDPEFATSSDSGSEPLGSEEIKEDNAANENTNVDTQSAADTNIQDEGTADNTHGTNDESSSSYDSDRSSEPLDTSTTHNPLDDGTSDSAPEYTETRRRKRDREFAREVKDAYNECCAVCGERRVAPNGNLEIEAAHIYPKAEGGPDDVRNGVALCRLHHWAFDNGWFTVSDSYEIIVRDAAEYDGYDEFVDFDGDILYLPDETSLRPHPEFLDKHRSLYGFDE